MQLENSNDKIKLRIIWILLAAAILLNVVVLIPQIFRYGEWFALWDLVMVMPYIVLLVEVAFIWEKDKRHIGVFAYLVLQGVSSGFISFARFAGTIITVVLWIGVIVLFCKGFQKWYFRGIIIPKYCLLFALLATSSQFGYFLSGMVYYTSFFTLPSFILPVFAVYLLFDNFSFAPPFQKVDPIKNELELLQKKYELGILSEEEYQQKRQDIISRI